MAIDTTTIINAEALISTFGEWPDFHDAEVHAIRMDRGSGKPQLDTDIHVFRYTGEVAPTWFLAQADHTLASLRFEGIEELELDGFNQQNALAELVITDLRGHQLDVLRWDIELRSAHGVGAQFKCERIVVLDVIPFTGEETGS